MMEKEGYVSYGDEFIKDLIDYYETRIQKIEEVFNSSESFFNSVQVLNKEFNQALNKLQEERSHLNEELREKMAKKGSLRKNDYDRIMDEVFVILNKKEQDAKLYLSAYINDQKEMVRLMRKKFLAMKDNGAGDYRKFIEDFKEEIKQIRVHQQEREAAAMSKIVDLQSTYNKILENFRFILEKDEQIKPSDIKAIKKHLLKDFITKNNLKNETRHEKT